MDENKIRYPYYIPILFFLVSTYYMIGCKSPLNSGNINDDEIHQYRDYLKKLEAKYDNNFVNEETVIAFSDIDSPYTPPYNYVRCATKKGNRIVGISKSSRYLKEDKVKINELFNDTSTVDSKTVNFDFTGEKELYEFNDKKYRIKDIIHMDAPTIIGNSATGKINDYFESIQTLRYFPIEIISITHLEGPTHWNKPLPMKVNLHDGLHYSQFSLVGKGTGENEISKSKLILRANNKEFTYWIFNYTKIADFIRIK